MVTHETEIQSDVTLGTGEKDTAQETYSKADVTKLVTEAKTSVMAEAGRSKAEAEKALKAANDALGRLAKMEQEKIDAELEQHKDDPAEVRRIRAEQKARQLEANLAKREQELADRDERLKKLDTEKAEATNQAIVHDVAKRLGVDVEKLIGLSKYTDGSLEAIEVLAKELPKVQPPKPGLKLDSNRSLGGNLTWESVRDAFIANPYDPAVRARYFEMKSQH